MNAWGSNTDRILLLLAQEPMSKAEICRRLDLTHDQVSNRLTHLRKKTPKYNKRIYITDYTRHAVWGRTYLRAVYALGDKKDVVKPRAMTPKERSRKAYEKVCAIRNSTVFRKRNETTRFMESQTKSCESRT